MIFQISNRFYSDIYIKDLSKFNVTGINFDLPNMFLNVSLVFESVTISGNSIKIKFTVPVICQLRIHP